MVLNVLNDAIQKNIKKIEGENWIVHFSDSVPFFPISPLFCSHIFIYNRFLFLSMLKDIVFNVNSLFFCLLSDAIWRTDLDFMVVHRDRLVVLSFMTSSPGSSSNNSMHLPTAQPFGSTSSDSDEPTSLPITRGLEDIVGSQFDDGTGNYF